MLKHYYLKQGIVIFKELMENNKISSLKKIRKLMK